jgi:hypothetical protein
MRGVRSNPHPYRHRHTKLRFCEFAEAAIPIVATRSLLQYSLTRRGRDQ